jgi:hypothetical protein
MKGNRGTVMTADCQHRTGDHDPDGLRSLLIEWLRRGWDIDDPALAKSPLRDLVERAVALSGCTYDPG